MGRGISAGTMGIALVAIVVGLVGAYVVRMNLITTPPPVVEAPEPQTFPLATTDLPAGRTLTLGDIGLVRLTRDQITERGFNTGKEMSSPQQIIGRTLKTPIRQGQPFVTTALYLEGTRRDFTEDLKPGYRAFSMQLPSDRGGNLPAGSFVDVVFRSTEKKPEQGRRGIPEVTVRLLEGVEVIDVYNPPVRTAAARTDVFDVSNRNRSNAPPPPTVTLSVTPEQADILQTTTGRGELTLVARPQDERVMVASTRPKPKTLEDVLGIEYPPPQQVVLFATEIYRRGARSVNVYRDDKLVEQLRSDAAADDVANPPMPMGADSVPLDPLNPARPAPLPPAPMPPVPDAAPLPAPLP